jgi:aldose 1-epimerase
VNLCHHPYFMLPGAADSRGHRLWVDAQTALAVDSEGFPTGGLEPVAAFAPGMAQDNARGRCSATIPSGLDRTFVLGTATRADPVRVAVLEAGIRMELWTTQSALHVYDGAKIAPGTPLRDGRRAGPFAGIALEAQGWTDAPNHPTFPDTALAAGAEYRQTTIYRSPDPSGPLA